MKRKGILFIKIIKELTFYFHDLNGCNQPSQGIIANSENNLHNLLGLYSAGTARNMNILSAVDNSK